MFARIIKPKFFSPLLRSSSHHHYRFKNFSKVIFGGALLCTPLLFLKSKTIEAQDEPIPLETPISTPNPEPQTTTRPAGILKRVFAYFIDSWLIVFTISLLVNLVLYPFPKLRESWYIRAMSLILQAILLGLRDCGYSLGKKWLKLRVESRDGSAVNWKTSLKRNWATLFFIVMQPWIEDSVWIATYYALFWLYVIGDVVNMKVVEKEEQRTLGDMVANTRVVEVKKL